MRLIEKYILEVRCLVREAKYNHVHNTENGEFGSNDEFPTSEEFQKVTLKRIPKGFANVSYIVSSGEKQWYAKKQKGTFGTADLEVRAYQLGKIMGADKVVVPQTLLSRGKEVYNVGSLLDGFKTFSEDMAGARKAVKAMSSKDFTTMHIYSFLAGDADRHKGNYMFHPETGEVKIIDMGGAFDTPARDDGPKEFPYNYVGGWRPWPLEDMRKKTW